MIGPQSGPGLCSRTGRVLKLLYRIGPMKRPVRSQSGPLGPSPVRSSVPVRSGLRSGSFLARLFSNNKRKKGREEFTEFVVIFNERI